MPTIQHDHATIYYEEFGQGFPILTYAPTGLASTIKIWSAAMSTRRRRSRESSASSPWISETPADDRARRSPRMTVGTRTRRTISRCSITSASTVVISASIATSLRSAPRRASSSPGMTKRIRIRSPKKTAKLLPNSGLIAEWKAGAALESARVRVKEFYASRRRRDRGTNGEDERHPSGVIDGRRKTEHRAHSRRQPRMG